MPVDDEEWVPDQKAIVDAVYKETTKNGFYDPYQQSDEELITKNNIANLISSPLGCIESEVDLWCLLYRAVDNLFMKTKRDNISISMDISQNEDRIVSYENSIPTKSNYFKDGLEYGTAECGKTEDALAKKNSVETRLHIPKIMKAMFHRTSMKVYVMNNPDECVLRVLKSNEFEVGSMPSMMQCSLEISIKIKGYLTNNDDNKDPDFISNQDNNNDEIALPRLLKNDDKRQKSDRVPDTHGRLLLSWLATNAIKVYNESLAYGQATNINPRAVQLTYTETIPLLNTTIQKMWHLQKLKDPEIRQNYITNFTSSLQPLQQAITHHVENDNTTTLNTVEDFTSQLDNIIYDTLDITVGRKTRAAINRLKWFWTPELEQAKDNHESYYKKWRRALHPAMKVKWCFKHQEAQAKFRLAVNRRRAETWNIFCQKLDKGYFSKATATMKRIRKGCTLYPTFTDSNGPTIAENRMAGHLKNICAGTNQHQRQHSFQAIDAHLLHHPTIEDDDSPFTEEHIEYDDFQEQPSLKYNGLHINCLLYVDDVALIGTWETITLLLKACEEHSIALGFQWNLNKCVYMSTTAPSTNYTPKLYDTDIQRTNNFTYPGVPFNQAGLICTKALVEHSTTATITTMNVLASIGVRARCFEKLLCTRLYRQFLRPKTEHGLAITNLTNDDNKLLQEARQTCLRKIFGTRNNRSMAVIHHLGNLEYITERITILQAKFLFRSHYMPDDALFPMLRPYIILSKRTNAWNTVVKKNNIWNSITIDTEDIITTNIKTAIKHHRQQSYEKRCERKHSILLNACRNRVGIDPILWIPMSPSERILCIHYRLGWMINYQQQACPNCNNITRLSKQHLKCFNVHSVLSISPNIKNPISYIFNRLPKLPPTASHRQRYYNIVWPKVCYLLHQCHRTCRPDQYTTSSSSASQQFGQLFLEWIKPSAKLLSASPVTS
ncbi:hypothetical protein BDC45DRAFT_567419 [Circinella umbellata]|nr:hypothetical protein BDC45DRAFT_567419 [Circinella umbellata]